MQPQTCLCCGHVVNLVHVHGHYQCPVCHTNTLPCCDGDNCHTNLTLAAFEENEATPGTSNNTAAVTSRY